MTEFQNLTDQSTNEETLTTRRIRRIFSYGINSAGTRSGADGHSVNPTGIACSAGGDIAISDPQNSCIIILDGKVGMYKRTIGLNGRNTGQLNMPDGITYDTRDHLVVSDYGNHRIQLFDCRTEKVSLCFGNFGSSDGELEYPSGLSVDSSSNDIIVSDWGNNRIQIFDMYGNYKWKFGSLDSVSASKSLAYCSSYGGRPSGCGEPVHCVVHNDCFYVSDADKVKVFSQRGVFMHSFDGACLQSPHGLLVNQQGNLWVCDTNMNCVKELSLDGKVIGSTSGETVRWPIYLAQTNDGSVLVSEWGAHRVSVLK